MDLEKWNSIKEDIRLRLDITTVVERYVTLKRAGANFKGLCPFHKEKSPSFIVSPDKGIYHCFGCGAGGDIFSFLMGIEGVSFMEALKLSAKEVGINVDELSDRKSSYSDTQGYNRDTMLMANEYALAYFYKEMRNSPEAITFFKERGLKAETVRDFKLGFAPDGWSNLLDLALNNGYTQHLFLTVGLAVASSKTGKAYDRFRKRIIFPIFDMSGRPVAFGGRTIDADGQPKYLNSPETPLYQKNRIFYGLNTAREGIRDRGYALVVEGYMDLLMLYQAGIQNAIATCGTAMTREHGYNLKRFTDKVYFVFDGDSAGLKAAQRAIDNLLPLELDIRVVILPDGDDPDTLIQREGAEGFEKLITSAQSALDFYIGFLSQSFDLTAPQGRAHLVQRLAQLIATVENELIRIEYSKIICDRFDVQRESFLSLMESGKLPNNSVISEERKQSKESYYNTLLSTEEGSLLHILVSYPKLLENWIDKISLDLFSESIFSEMFSIILQYGKQNGSGATYELGPVLGDLKNNSVKELLSLMLIRETEVTNPEEWIAHKVSKLKSTAIERKKQRIVEELANTVDSKRKMELLGELTQLTRNSK